MESVLLVVKTKIVVLNVKTVIINSFQEHIVPEYVLVLVITHVLHLIVKVIVQVTALEIVSLTGAQNLVIKLALERV